MTEIADRYRTLADAFEAKVAAVSPDDWSNPSPCSEWTARDLVGHVVDVHGMMLRPLDRAERGAVRRRRPARRVPLAGRPRACADDPSAPTPSTTACSGAPRSRTPSTSSWASTSSCTAGTSPGRPGRTRRSTAEVERILGFVDRMGTATMRENGVTGPEVAVPRTRPSRTGCSGCSGVSPRVTRHARDGGARDDARGPPLQVAEAPAEADERRRVVDVGGVGLEVTRRRARRRR